MSGLVVEQAIVRLGGREVLRGASFSAAAGAVTALVGPNGAGKSTLLKAALGLVPLAGGTIRLDGEDLLALDERARARRVAWVPQRSRLQAAMTVENVVAAGRFAHRGLLARLSAADRAAIDGALSATDATGLAARRFDQLSTGEQQRALLARALATGASAILLDEPTASLDLGHALALAAVLRRLAADGRCIVVVLHQLDDLRRCADRCALIDGGVVVAEDAVEAMLASPRLHAAYGVEPTADGGWRLAPARSGA